MKNASRQLQVKKHLNRPQSDTIISPTTNEKIYMVGVVLFNNCKGADHAEIYRDPTAFYDLGAEGKQAKLANDLLVGQICVVCGKPDDRERIHFSWHRLESEYIAERENSGFPCRVFSGSHISNEVLSRTKAIKHKIYSEFFDVRGHFKQSSVLHLQLLRTNIPKSDSRSTELPDEIVVGNTKFREGTVKQVLVNAYERNTRAKRLCKQRHGTNCVICGFSFAENYGDFAADFIHVHHLIPISSIGKDHDIDPVKDMRPVCPNCHAAIHLGGENRSIADLKKAVAKNRNKRGAK